MSEHVWYFEYTDKIIVVSHQQHASFGAWFYPAHGGYYLGKL